MVEFEKGHWNIDELEIQEWIKPKQKGFQRVDVKTLRRKLLEDLNKTIDKPNYKLIVANSIKELVKIKKDEFKEILTKRFGF